MNLAAVHRDDVRDRSEYQHTNVDGTENVATVCSEKGINKIVFTSTVAVYGFAKAGTDETGRISPFNEYGRTKYEAEEKLRAWQSKGRNSLIIVRPTVIFGEGNRGNVFNLLNQIRLENFLWSVKAKMKSMAYIGNVISFLEACIATDQKYGIYNYVDKPDLTMNELVSQVRLRLRGKNGVGFRLTYWLGMILGYTADFISAATRKNLPVSSIRVKKFTSSTEFSTSKHLLDDFEAPYELRDGIEQTLQSEFIAPNPEKEIFFTE